MNPLQAALREKYGSPEKALEALGLPSTLLAADQLEPGPTSRRSSKMAKLSVTANRVHAALQALYGAKLAADAKLDLLPVVQGITKANFKTPAMKAQVLAKAKTAAVAAGLAMDEAGPDDVAMRILDMIDGGAPSGGAEEQIDEGMGSEPGAVTTEGNAAPPPAEGAGGEEGEKKPPVEGAAPEGEAPDPEKMKALMAKLGGDAEMAKACYDICMGGAKDEVVAPAETEVPAKQPPAEDEEEAPMMKPAMDAAINTAVAQVKADMRAEARAAAEARLFVKPWVGEVSMAFDTAETILKASLDALGVKTKGIHPSAYRAILENLPKPGSGKRERGFAMDSAPSGKSAGAHASKLVSRIQVMG
jgi:hypothetical protein